MEANLLKCRAYARLNKNETNEEFEALADAYEFELIDDDQFEIEFKALERKSLQLDLEAHKKSLLMLDEMKAITSRDITEILNHLESMAA